MYVFDTDGVAVSSGIVNIAFAMADVHAVVGGLVDRAITDETARTIADKWTGNGHPETEHLAKGEAYDTDALLDEIVEHQIHAGLTAQDEKALGCLYVWATERKGAFL